MADQDVAAKVLKGMMSKLKSSLIKKLRKANHGSSLFSPLIRRLDKKANLNLAQTSRYFHQDKTLSSLATKAESALKHVLDDIQVEDDLTLNKTLWVYWDKGFEAAPEVVKVAVESWQALNPEYELVFLDEQKVQTYYDFKSLFYNLTLDAGIAHKSDFIRTYLLARFGGIWVDSTTFCCQPLALWLNDEIQDNGFFVFKQKADRKDRQIKNWFIVASKGNPIMVDMLKQLVDYNFKPRDKTLFIQKYPAYAHLSGISREGTGFALLQQLDDQGIYPYFYYHYLFNEVVANGKAKVLWEKAKHKGNAHANGADSLEGAWVSKQSYRGKYVKSDVYQQRVRDVKALIEAQG